MSRNREADCCEYREERRRLKKLRKKRMDRSVSQKSQNGDCDDDDDETEEQRKSEEKRAKRVDRLFKLLSEGDETMGRVKPTIKERDHYAMDGRHIRCFLEPDEIAKLEYEGKIRTFVKKPTCQTCDTFTTSPQSMKKIKKKKKKKKKPKEKNGEKTKAEKEASSNAEEQQIVNGESKPEADKDEPERKDGPNKKHVKRQFWCRKVERKIDVKDPDRKFDEIDCKDSVCSFDSQIDLSGLALTKKDMKKIAEMRRSRIMSKDESKERTQR